MDLVSVILFGTYQLCVLIFYGVYKSAGTPRGTVFLGGYIPSWTVKSPEIQALSAEYHRSLRRLSLPAAVAGLPMLLGPRLPVSLLMIYFFVWMGILIAGSLLISAKAFQKLFRLKKEKSWFCPETLSLYTPKDGSEPFLADDDQYWLKGWYCNPNDKRLLVADRVCATNYGLNTGRKAGIVLNTLLWGGMAAGMIWLSALMLDMDFRPFSMTIQENRVTVDGGMYGAAFDVSDITDLELLDALPEGKRNRRNGAATSQYLLGKFTIAGYGDCRLFYYRESSPVIRIETEEYNVFFNTRDSQKTRGLYQELETRAASAGVQ